MSQCWETLSFYFVSYTTQGLHHKWPLQSQSCRASKNGKSIWVEYEVVDMMLQWDMASRKGAWITISDELIEEVKKETGLDLDKQHQGLDNLKKYLEENKDIGKYLFFKFRDVLKKS